MSFDNDMFMVRTAEKDGFSLAAGEPDFLAQNLSFLNIIEPITEPLRYPPLNGMPELLEELYLLHPEFKYIVVANGAKQGLSAAMYAFGQPTVIETTIRERNKEPELRKELVYGKSLIYHPAPYWPSYKTLAKIAGMGFTNTPDVAAIKVATSPNNPDGSEADPNDSIDIMDCAYYNPSYPVYGHTQKPNGTVNVFSGSKMFGLSGLRIGWVGTNNKDLASKMGHYVEMTTTGVSLLSQMHMASILRHVRRFQDATPEFKKAQLVLQSNAGHFVLLLGEFCDKVSGCPKGMFQWIKAKDPIKFDLALKQAKVSYVPGSACGMTEPGWYRFSMGWSSDYTERALRTLRKELLGF